jgi:uncharacterized SAM-dependent methyltransferase
MTPYSENAWIEMNLEARRDVTVRLPDGPRTFGAGARIHTENSYRYTERRAGRHAFRARRRGAVGFFDSTVNSPSTASRPSRHRAR